MGDHNKHSSALVRRGVLYGEMWSKHIFFVMHTLWDVTGIYYSQIYVHSTPTDHSLRILSHSSFS